MRSLARPLHEKPAEVRILDGCGKPMSLSHAEGGHGTGRRLGMGGSGVEVGRLEASQVPARRGHCAGVSMIHVLSSNNNVEVNRVESDRTGHLPAHFAAPVCPVRRMPGIYECSRLSCEPY